ncbi:hypothetical protein G7066_14425 [Leucobacter coleopterorum]|uniref:Uncharacterized protein n=1 Tax=Leucobacter coleopterorum TaxID=2714933 RepID=A0ABX6JYR9_9MICO|nr:hypothetical protein [Leucobacter coleopterorum]QIM19468.1 hypothetical protein G7066_14425 [Leucobacter coleopterorum]
MARDISMKKAMVGIGAGLLAALAFCAMTIACISISMSDYVVVHGFNLKVVEVPENAQPEAVGGLVIAIMFGLVAIVSGALSSMIAFREFHPWAAIFPVLALLGGFALGLSQI